MLSDRWYVPRRRSMSAAAGLSVAALCFASSDLAAQRPASSRISRPASPAAGRVITDDIARFWNAYDTVRALPDTLEQVRAMQRLYIDRGSPGLQGLIAARRYTAREFAGAIREYPRYWESIRPSTLRAAEMSRRIARGLASFQRLYPEGRPADVYFAIGVLRTPGTIFEGRVLIGAELALADPRTVTSDLPPRFSNIAPYVARDPIAQVAPLNVHEYVHTQQRQWDARVLDLVLAEGIAEYLSVLATGVPSAYAPLEYERTHRDSVSAAFARDLLSRQSVDRWLYNDTSNRFGVRDLGYAVGYEIARRYVVRSPNRRSAIRSLVELDYAKPQEVARVVDLSGYLERPLSAVLASTKNRRPTVTGVDGLGQDSAGGPVRRLTVHFSTPMDTTARGFDFGTGGEAQSMRVERLLGWAADGRSLTIEVRLPSSRPAQLVISEWFADADGMPLRPFLVEIPHVGK
jgi:Predicted Zn-dependent protease (DUF2268)